MTPRQPRTGDVLEVFSDERKRSFLNIDGLGKPLRSPISQSVVDRARAYRLRRMRDQVVAHDCAAMIMFSPINIRYAFDYANMQIWSSRERTRHALLFGDGPAIMHEYKGAEHMVKNGAGVDIVLPATTWLYMISDSEVADRAKRWAAEIADLVRQYGGGNRRVAADNLDPLGLRALEALGIEVVDGQELAEKARSIKSADEIELMRWTIRVAESGMWRMHAASVHGATENEIWAEIHHENIRSGGEWFEARLLSSGPRTNPWYQEASDREIREGEMISFDTDMIGPYGYCADLSRSWTCGHVPMNATQQGLYRLALDQIEQNTGILRAGMSFAEFNEKSWKIPEVNQPFRYSLAIHGVGLVDEWPVVPLHVDTDGSFGAREGRFHENMVVCVESLTAAPGTESIKLETQVLITKGGPVRLDDFPWEMC
ncbi:MAG: Xaa-Pro peptidase family protein [Geminicoccaceae bacterium]